MADEAARRQFWAAVEAIVEAGSGEASVMTAKRLFVAEFGLIDGFAAFRARMTHLPEIGEIRPMPLVGLHEVAQQGALFYHLVASPEPFVGPLPRIVGAAPDNEDLGGKTRSMFIACLGNARVRARSNLIEYKGLAVADREGTEWIFYNENYSFDPAVFYATEEDAWIIAPPGDGASIELDEAFTLLGIRPYSFGHWLIEHLARYIAATQTGMLPPVPILVEAGMAETHYQALRLMLPQPVEIVELPPGATARVGRLWCAPNQAVYAGFAAPNEWTQWDDTALPPQRYAAIAREMARRIDMRAGAVPTGSDRLFLARKPGMSRDMVNAATLEAAAERRGFRKVYLEDHPFAEQARLLRNAGHVIGPMGSAMLMTYLMRPGMKVCVLAYVEYALQVQGFLTSVLDALGIDATVVVGSCVRFDPEAGWRSDFQIDPEVFCRFLDDWLPR